MEGIIKNGNQNPMNMLDAVANLKKAGFEQEKAEAVVRMQYQLVESTLVTKNDLDKSLAELNYKLTIRMGILYGGSLGAIFLMAKMGLLAIQ